MDQTGTPMLRIPAPPRLVRVIGFDDAPFARRPGARVHFAGVVCAGTRMQGMLWGALRRDGWNATQAIVSALRSSRYADQVHLVLLDGIAMGGFNVIDLAALSSALDRPCLALMRRRPDLEAMRAAMARLPRPERRWEILQRAGPVHEAGRWIFNAVGLPPERVPDLLERLTWQGNVPEALRLAHLIGAAVREGEDRGRA